MNGLASLVIFMVLNFVLIFFSVMFWIEYYMAIWFDLFLNDDEIF